MRARWLIVALVASGALSGLARPPGWAIDALSVGWWCLVIWTVARPPIRL